LRPLTQPALLLACATAILATPAAFAGPPHAIRETYFILYDEKLEVRTDQAPPSEVKEKGRPLTRKELQALKDEKRPGYRASRPDLLLAKDVTAYLEEEVAAADGKARRVALPPLRCLVHQSRPSDRVLVLYHQVVGYGNPPPPYLVGQGNKGTSGIPLPKVRLKMVLVHSYYTPPPKR
jgi:hypothetical protein